MEDVRQSAECPIYCAADGMEGLAHQLGKTLQKQGAHVRTQMWASAAERTPDGRWDIKWDLWSMAVTDYLVVAHSGKCAKRLTSARGLERCHEVVNRVQLGVIWCFVVVFRESLALPFDVAFAEGSKIVWASNQTAKFGSTSEASSECWVILSSNKFGWLHKVPQEFVSQETSQAIASELLVAFETLVSPVRPTASLPEVIHQQVQLWGAGPSSVVLDHADAVFDPLVRAGVCADWCVAPCVEGAVLSGLQLADVMAAHRRRLPGSAYTMYPEGKASLHECKRICDIAAFPGWLDAPTVSSTSTIALGQYQSCSMTHANGMSDDKVRSPWPSRSNEAMDDACEESAMGTQSVPQSSLASDISHKTLPNNSSALQKTMLPTTKCSRWTRRHLPVESDVYAVSLVEEAAVPEAGKNKRWRTKGQTAPTVRNAIERPDLNRRDQTRPQKGALLWASSDREELQPGLVLLRGIVSSDAQQWIADEVSRVGGILEETRSRSEGFYRISHHGKRELNSQSEQRGSFVRLLEECDPLFEELCMQCFQAALEKSEALPQMHAKACVFNYYEENSPGLRWHRDIDETLDNLRQGSGRPVVSISIGDDCTFEFQPIAVGSHPRQIHLRSGDVLVFGGPSRGILHAVTCIYARTRPEKLEMLQGRFNLTFRHHC